MHYVEAKSILSNNNGLNIYRGCTHGCIYCDSRSKCYNMKHEFTDVEVKKNALDLLSVQLRRKKEKCMIGTGSMSDPYMPLEEKLEYTRNVLKLIYKYKHGFTCITKSDLILRDLDLLKKINNQTKAVIQISLTCIDDKISKLIEPNVITTRERIELLDKLEQEDIPTVVWLTPILPYITDTQENIEEILDYCIQYNVQGIICFGMGMTLRDENRRYYYQKLDEHFPGLKYRYINEYKNSYAIESPNNKQLMKLFKSKTDKYNIMNNPADIFKYLHHLPMKDKSKQMKLF